MNEKSNKWAWCCDMGLLETMEFIDQEMFVDWDSSFGYSRSGLFTIFWKFPPDNPLSIRYERRIK